MSLSIVTRLLARGVALMGLTTVGLIAGPAMSGLGAPRVERPHNELAFNGDPQLCPRLRDLYDRLLTEAIRGDARARRAVDLYLTDFAVNGGTSFAQIGLRLPAGMKNGPLDGVHFYTVTLDGEPRTIAVLDCGGLTCRVTA